MDKRLEMLREWFEDSTGEELQSIAPASADASFRRYFRAVTPGHSYVLMDAPPEKESIGDFVKADKALIAQQVHAPKIYHQDSQLGFICLEDLGDKTYLAELRNSPNPLYSQAIDALINIQLGTFQQTDLKLPLYDKNLLAFEMSLFEDWYVKIHLNLDLSRAQLEAIHNAQEYLVESCLSQPQVWVHRDYHSRNLMVCEENNPAVIDFQDLLVGPIAYDLASLFKDCYIQWPRAQQLDWCREYYQKACQRLPAVEYDFDTLVKWFDLAGLQRHLKVLGIFCRLNYRDGKSQYLADLPMVESYVDEVVSLHIELKPLARAIKPIFEQSRKNQQHGDT